MFATAKDNKLNAAKDGMISEGGHTAGDAEEAAGHFKRDARNAAADVKDGLEDVARRTGHLMCVSWPTQPSIALRVLGRR